MKVEGSISREWKCCPAVSRSEISLRGAQTSGDLEVLPDPRVEISLEDRIRKRNANLQGLLLTRTFLEIRERTEALSEGLRAIERDLGEREDPVAQELGGFVASIWEALELIGVRMEVSAQNRRTVSSMGSTRDAPTEAERIGLFRLEEGIDRIVPMVNALLTGQVADFKRALGSAGMSGLPDLTPIRR